MGQTRDGKQLGQMRPDEFNLRIAGITGFGLSVANFATQTETIEVFNVNGGEECGQAHYPELCVARTAVLDYFQSPQQRRSRHSPLAVS
jgi:hypothetical protein